MLAKISNVLKQAKCFGKDANIRKTRKDRGVKIADASFEKGGNGKMSVMQEANPENDRNRTHSKIS